MAPAVGTAASMLQSDPISGRCGSATILIGATVEDLFEAKDVTATMDILTEDVPMMGVLSTPKKVYGWSGSISMNLYYVTARFRELALIYATTGVMSPFVLNIENSDNASSAGTQSVTLTGCQLTGSLDLGKIDSATGALSESVSASFSGVIYTSQFDNTIEQNIANAVTG